MARPPGTNHKHKTHVCHGHYERAHLRSPGCAQDQRRARCWPQGCHRHFPPCRGFHFGRVQGASREPVDRTCPAHFFLSPPRRESLAFLLNDKTRIPSSWKPPSDPGRDPSRDPRLVRSGIRKYRFYIKRTLRQIRVPNRNHGTLPLTHTLNP